VCLLAGIPIFLRDSVELSRMVLSRQIRRTRMKSDFRFVLIALMFLLGGAGNTNAQVKHVQMHIAGYLCGN